MHKPRWREEHPTSQLLDVLYAAAFDPAAAERLPGDLSSLVGGGSAVLWTVTPRTGALAGPMLTNYPTEAIEAYAAHYWRSDPWMGRFPLMTPNTAVRGSSIVDDGVLARTAYYNEFGRLYGMFHVLGAVLPLDIDEGMVYAAVAVLRPERGGGFEDAEAARLQRLLPHIRRAAQLAAVVKGTMARHADASLQAALDAFCTPAVMVDGEGCTVTANAAAEALDAARLGFALRRRSADEPLQLGDVRINQAFQRACTEVAYGGEGGVVRLAFSDSEPWLGVVTPLPLSLASLAGTARAIALLVLRPLGRTGEEVMRRRAGVFFGLTPAEANVAALLAGGLSPSEIAESRDVKISTVRSLLRRAQEKAEARDLRDLVRLMLALRT